MGSSLKINLNGEKVAFIAHEETKEIPFEAGDRLQVSFSLLKSQEKFLSQSDDKQELVIEMNPTIKKSYLSFFVLFAALPLLIKSWALAAILLLGYAFFALSAFNKFYLIKEKSDD